MKKIKIGMTSFNSATTIIAVYGIALFSVVLLTEKIEKLVVFGAIIIAAMLIHLAVAAMVNERRDWMTQHEPVIVADWGPWGRIKSKTILPAGLREAVVFAPAREVESKAKEIEQLLRDSGNEMFEPPANMTGIKVHRIYYACGKNLEERWNPKVYKKRLFNTSAQILIDFHADMEEGSPESGFSKQAYKEKIIDPQKNGSVW